MGGFGTDKGEGVQNPENLADVICNRSLKLITSPVKTHYGADLELSHVSRFDSGVYLCLANNGIPPTVSKRVRLYVDCK